MVKSLAGTRLRDTRQVPLHDRPLAQRGGGLSCGRSSTSKGRQGPGTPHTGGGFRANLTIFTVTNVVGELVGELNLRSVEVFLRFSSAL